LYPGCEALPLLKILYMLYSFSSIPSLVKTFKVV
jgi:hypothetical protein